jgi:uncharacterized membrane protein
MGDGRAGNGFTLLAFAVGAILILVALVDGASIAIAVAHGIPLRTLSATKSAVLDIFTDIIIPLIGGIMLIAAAMKLLNTSQRRIVRSSARKERVAQKEKAINTFLNDDEKKVITLIKSSKSGMLQSDIVIKSGFSKVKAHRILKGLENKNLIKRGRFGITNKVILND